MPGCPQAVGKVPANIRRPHNQKKQQAGQQQNENHPSKPFKQQGPIPRQAEHEHVKNRVRRRLPVPLRFAHTLSFAVDCTPTNPEKHGVHALAEVSMPRAPSHPDKAIARKQSTAGVPVDYAVSPCLIPTPQKNAGANPPRRCACNAIKPFTKSRRSCRRIAPRLERGTQLLAQAAGQVGHHAQFFGQRRRDLATVQS